MKYLYETSFSSTIKPLVSAEKDEYLALASLTNLGEFVPDVDAEKNVDLLPIAFNACVANRINKNDDVVDTETAIAIAQSFINKQINIEHNREKVVGVILKAGFSAFGSDEPLTEEEVKELDGPFNITLGGIVWRVVNSALADIIEDASDPTSDNFERVSASWELGFNQFKLVLLEDGEKNIGGAETIEGSDKVEKLKENLRALGGSGEIDGKKVYRQVVGKVLPLGIGLTETPAADVKGVATDKTVEEEENEPKKEEDTKTKIKKSEEKISQSKETTVTKIKAMKIESVKDITEENWSELSASVVSKFIEDQIKEASEKYDEAKNKYEEDLKATNDKADSLTQEHADLKDKFEDVSEKLEKIETAEAERQKTETFNQRMASLDEIFNLEDSDRKILSAQIKDLDNDGFEAHVENLKILMSSKIKQEEKKEKEEEKHEESTASTKTEEALEKATEEAEKEEEAVANAKDQEESLKDKMAKAFDPDQFEIKL